MRVWVIAAPIVVACGRFGFDAQVARDAPIDARPATPALVSMTGKTTGDTTAVTALAVSIPPSVAGDLLVVAIAEHHGDTVTSVVDGAGTHFVSAGARAVMGGTASELWYQPSAASTNKIVVTTNVASAFDVWVAELVDVRPGAPESIASRCLQYPPTIVTAPGVTTSADELVFTVMMAQAPLFVADMAAPFTGFPPLTGNAAGFLVAAQPGSYGATYDIASGAGMTAMTCASTAVWPPAP